VVNFFEDKKTFSTLLDAWVLTGLIIKLYTQVEPLLLGWEKSIECQRHF